MAALAFAATQFHTTGMTEPLLGCSINRLEDARFVRGRGRYVADLATPNALHSVVVRSPFNCSSVKKITFAVGANSYFECGREIALYAVVTRHGEKALVTRHWRK